MSRRSARHRRSAAIASKSSGRSTGSGICRSLIYIEIRDGRLKARKIGRRTIIATEDGEEWFSKLPRVGAA
jgi:hypothetical protein